MEAFFNFFFLIILNHKKWLSRWKSTENLQHSNGRLKTRWKHLQILIITADLLLIGHVAWLKETRIEIVAFLLRWLAGCWFTFESNNCWACGRVDNQIGTRSNCFVFDDVGSGWFCLVFGIRRFKKVLVSGVVLCEIQKASRTFLIIYY